VAVDNSYLEQYYTDGIARRAPAFRNKPPISKVMPAPKHVGAKGVRRMVFWNSTNDRCPACLRAMTLPVIEPHPTRTGWEIHTFNCDRCGPTKSKVVKVPLAA
jgi:hypothetical protein